MCMCVCVCFVVDALQVLTCLDKLGDRETAGQILRRIPINMRKDLLSRLDPALAARCIQVSDASNHVHA
jgi:hypothetical protein